MADEAPTARPRNRNIRERRIVPRMSLRRWLPHTLFGRALVIIATPLLLVQVVSAYVFFAHHWDRVSRRLALGLGGDIAALAENIELYREDRAHFLSSAKLHMNLTGQFTANAELVQPPPRGTLFERDLVRIIGERVRQPFHVDTGSAPGWVTVRVQLSDGVLTVVAPEKRLFTSTTYVFVMWTVGVSIILLGIAIVFLRNQLKPINQLAAAAESFGMRRQDVPLKIRGATEVRQATKAFLEMRDRIQRQITQRTTMLAGVSHDLRTPLTRMKLQLAMLGDIDGAAELAADVADMEEMVEEYLSFARGEGQESPVPTDLNVLLRDVAASSNAGRETAVAVTTKGDLVIPVRPNALKRCFTNLIDNGLRHGQRVKVGARRLAKTVEITFDDDGPGIAKSEREAVFRPFHRLDQSRNPETGGVGLGLTIARDVVRGHGGEIHLDDAPSGGLRASLRLPV